MGYAILIPGKSNSSRLPGKNFMQFNEISLIDKTIEFAKSLGGHRIYISTDLRDFERDGCTTIVRPAFIGKDVDMKVVVDHAITKIKEKNIILLQVTTPVRTKEQIEKAVSAFEYHEFKKNIVFVNMNTLIPNGYCFIFPKNRYIWDYPLYVIGIQPTPDIDYIWDFRIAEAIERGDYDGGGRI